MRICLTFLVLRYEPLLARTTSEVVLYGIAYNTLNISRYCDTQMFGLAVRAKYSLYYKTLTDRFRALPG